MTKELLNHLIEERWVEECEAAKKDGRKPGRARVWKSISKRCSKSYVEKTIKQLPPPNTVDSEKFDPWIVWPDRPIAPGVQAFLMRLDAAKRATEGIVLSQQEASWGKRLCASLEGLDQYRQYRIIAVYARRQFTADYLGKDRPYTADLDAMVSYRPWLPENQEPYEYAVVTGIAPAPFILPSPERDGADKVVDELLQQIEGRWGERVEPVFPDELQEGWATLLFEFLYPLPAERVWDVRLPRDSVHVGMLNRLARFWSGIPEIDYSHEEEESQ